MITLLLLWLDWLAAAGGVVSQSRLRHMTIFFNVDGDNGYRIKGPKGGTLIPKRISKRTLWILRSLLDHKFLIRSDHALLMFLILSRFVDYSKVFSAC